MYLFCADLNSGNGSPLKRYKVETLNENSKVSELRSKAAEFAHVNVKAVRLLHRGNLLEDDEQTLGSCNVTSTSSVHALPQDFEEENVNAAESSHVESISDDDIQLFMIAFGMAVKSPAFHRVAQRLSKRENLENFAAACPGLGQDPVAVAFLSKPELLLSLLEPATLRYVSEKHPTLRQAVDHLSAAVHQESNGTHPLGAASIANDGDFTSGGPFSYLMDELPEQEEGDEDMSDAEAIGGAAAGSTRQPSPSQITPDQLASAIQAAQSNTGSGAFGGTHARQGASGSASTAATPSTSSGGGGLITQNQLAAALAAATAPSASARRSQPMDSSSSSSSDTSLQVARMKEMGIADEGLALKALNLMGGDLQAAIDLVLSGWLGEDDSAN